MRPNHDLECTLQSPQPLEEGWFYKPDNGHTYSVSMELKSADLIVAAGLVDYWRARGWPDLCRPQGTDDFVCD